jgi:hypothetical protein
MIDLHPTLSHHLLELVVADRIGHLPAHAPKDDPTLEVAALEIHRHPLACQACPTITQETPDRQNLRQNLNITCQSSTGTGNTATPHS